MESARLAPAEKRWFQRRNALNINLTNMAQQVAADICARRVHAHFHVHVRCAETRSAGICARRVHAHTQNPDKRNKRMARCRHDGP